MSLWRERPIEIRNLFNPAFCGLNIYHAIKSYQEKNNHGMPFSLSLLILPLCLHEPTSLYLLQKRRTNFLTNLKNNPLIISAIDIRIMDMNLFTLEGIDFLLQVNAIYIDAHGNLNVNEIKFKNLKILNLSCQNKIKVSSYLGKQLAKINDRSTIYISLGIKP